MSIAVLLEQGKSLLGRLSKDALILAVLVLASLASFGLGYLSGRDAAIGEGGGITIEVRQQPVSTAIDDAVGSSSAQSSFGGAQQGSGAYVASKSGTKYYLSSCKGAARISEKNKVWFATATAAEAEGYTPASNCPGL